jgi:hypothetical protein
VILLFLVLGVLLYLYAEHAGLPMPEKGDQLFAVITMLICESRGERQLKFRCIIS